MDEPMWEPPEPFQRGRRGMPVGPWLAELRQHPGRWAKWPSPVNPLYGLKIKRGEYDGIEVGDYEAHTRTFDASGKRADPHKCWLYARYVGDGAVADTR